MPRSRSPGSRGTADGGVEPEGGAWRMVAEGWRPLYGSFRDLGFSFEWHDFRTSQDLDWARSFHPGSIELCLNLAGEAWLDDGRRRHVLGPRVLAFYHAGRTPLAAVRAAGQRHQFITIEYSPEFLARHLGGQSEDLHPLVRGVVRGEDRNSEVVVVSGAALELTFLAESLRRPPVFTPARRTWFASKATELAAHFFFQPADGELFCTRARRSGRERIEQAQGILRGNLQEPPTLEELARKVGCSPFYLSRLFSQEVGLTIQQYLRQIRLEQAAELLRTGACNVTEAAFAVGYSSLSHFSSAFHEAFGCCPGLYPLKFRPRPIATGKPRPSGPA